MRIIKDDTNLKSKKVINYFKNRIIKKNGCWNWTGSTTSQGYPVMCILGGRILGHRWCKFYYDNMDIKTNLLCCHKCDNPKCVNPKHIFIGTHKDNSIDMANKKRTWTQKPENKEKAVKIARENGKKASITCSGSDNIKSKLSIKDIEKILILKCLNKTHESIAEYYNISESVVSWIFQEKSYKKELYTAISKLQINREVTYRKSRRYIMYYLPKALAKLREIKRILKK